MRELHRGRVNQPHIGQKGCQQIRTILMISFLLNKNIFYQKIVTRRQCFSYSRPSSLRVQIYIQYNNEDADNKNLLVSNYNSNNKGGKCLKSCWSSSLNFSLFSSYFFSFCTSIWTHDSPYNMCPSPNLQDLFLSIVYCITNGT